MDGKRSLREAAGTVVRRDVTLEEAQAILAALALLSTDRKRNATLVLAELLGRRGSEWPCETPITWAREA
jgi:hypothetical protein